MSCKFFYVKKKNLISRHVTTSSVCLKAIVAVVFLAESVEIIRRKLTRTHSCLKG